MASKKSQSKKSIWFNRNTNVIVGSIAVIISLLIVIPYAQQRQTANQYADEANQNPVPSPQCAGSPNSQCNPENESEIDQDQENGGNASGSGKNKNKNKNKEKGKGDQQNGNGNKNASGSGDQDDKNGNGNSNGNQGGATQIIEMLKKLLEQILKLLSGGA